MERTIRVGDVDLAVLEAGAGGRPLLLVHGFTGAKEDFAWHVDDLAEAGWHVVAPDNRGHGSSAKPDDGYTFDHFAGDVLGLADALGWDRFALLGHSLGGVIVQQVALQAEDRLTALVLMDTTTGGIPVDHDLARLGIEVARTEGLEVVLAAMKDSPPLHTPAAKRLEETIEGWVETNDAKFLSCCAAMYAGVLEAWFALPDRDLSALRVPTLVLVGEQDDPFMAASHAIARSVEGARIEVIVDAGHSPQVENPEAWRKALCAFLDEAAG